MDKIDMLQFSEQESRVLKSVVQETIYTFSNLNIAWSFASKYRDVQFRSNETGEYQVVFTELLVKQ